MEFDQNLLLDDLEFFQPDIINIDDYLPCYDEVSHHTIDNTHQTTTTSSDVMITSPHINHANSELDIALNNILPTPQSSNLSISEYFPICDDLLIPTTRPPDATSDNTHKSELVVSTYNNVQPSTHQIHNTDAEPEIKQEFVTTNNIENNEWDAAYKKLKDNNATNTKKPKPVMKAAKIPADNISKNQNQS